MPHLLPVPVHPQDTAHCRSPHPWRAVWAHHTPGCRMGCSMGHRWKGTKTQQTPPDKYAVSFPWCSAYMWEQCLIEWVSRKHLLKRVKGRRKGARRGRETGKERGESFISRLRPRPQRQRQAFYPRPPAPLPGSDSKCNRVPEHGAESRGTDFLHLDHLLTSPNVFSLQGGSDHSSFRELLLARNEIKYGHVVNGSELFLLSVTVAIAPPL